jgi:hypothetical protein
MLWLQRADTIQADTIQIDTIQIDTIQTAGGIAVTIGNGVIAPLLREESITVRAEIATATPQEWDHQQNDHRDNALCTRGRAHASNVGGAIG